MLGHTKTVCNANLMYCANFLLDEMFTLKLHYLLERCVSQHIWAGKKVNYIFLRRRAGHFLIYCTRRLRREGTKLDPIMHRQHLSQERKRGRMEQYKREGEREKEEKGEGLVGGGMGKKRRPKNVFLGRNGRWLTVHRTRA